MSNGKSFVWLFEPSGPISVYETLGNWSRTQAIFKELAAYFNPIYIFSSDFKDYSSKMPNRCIHGYIGIRNNILRLLLYLFYLPIRFRRAFKGNVVCSNHLAIIPAIIAKFLFGSKILSRYPWRFFELERQKGNSLHAILARVAEILTFKFSDKVIVSTKRLRKYVASNNVDSKRIIVIPDCINISLFRPVRRRFGSTEKIAVLSVGRLTSMKNHGLLIKSVALLRKEFDCELTIIGQGPLKRELQDMAETLHVQMKLIDRVSNEQLPLYYNSCDFFVHCSRLEGCPLVVLEAMACGRPVIGTNIPGTNDIVTNYVNGILCNPDPKSISSAIELLASSQDLRNEICKNARETIVKNYSLKRAIGQIAASIEGFYGLAWQSYEGAPPSST